MLEQVLIAAPIAACIMVVAYALWRSIRHVVEEFMDRM